jgi:hypothetical protein
MSSDLCPDRVLIRTRSPETHRVTAKNFNTKDRKEQTWGIGEWWAKNACWWCIRSTNRHNYEFRGRLVLFRNKFISVILRRRYVRMPYEEFYCRSFWREASRFYNTKFKKWWALHQYLQVLFSIKDELYQSHSNFYSSLYGKSQLSVLATEWSAVQHRVSLNTRISIPFDIFYS